VWRAGAVPSSDTPKGHARHAAARRARRTQYALPSHGRTLVAGPVAGPRGDGAGEKGGPLAKARPGPVRRSPTHLWGRGAGGRGRRVMQERLPGVQLECTPQGSWSAGRRASVRAPFPKGSRDPRTPSRRMEAVGTSEMRALILASLAVAAHAFAGSAPHPLAPRSRSSGALALRAAIGRKPEFEVLCAGCPAFCACPHRSCRLTA
jgi:hypothetical protein